MILAATSSVKVRVDATISVSPRTLDGWPTDRHPPKPRLCVCSPESILIAPVGRANISRSGLSQVSRRIRLLQGLDAPVVSLVDACDPFMARGSFILFASGGRTRSRWLRLASTCQRGPVWEAEQQQGERHGIAIPRDCSDRPRPNPRTTFPSIQPRRSCPRSLARPFGAIHPTSRTKPSCST